MLSPTRIIGEDNNPIRTPRSAFGIVGNNEEDVLFLDKKLREILLK